MTDVAVEAVLPGCPARVRLAAGQLMSISTGLLRLAAVLRQTEAVDWHGVAAAAFRQLVCTDADPVARAGAVLAQAAEHLNAHARVLTIAQDDARRAVLLDQRAAWATREWQEAGARGPDPGALLRCQAAAVLAEARRRVRCSGAASAEGLRAARRLAPHPPSPLARLVAREHEQARQLDVGALESTVDLLLLGLRFSDTRLGADPAGYVDDVRSAVASSAAWLHDPRDAALSALDVDTWRDSPARWLGHLVPGLALGATGTATAAARPATLALRLRALLPTQRAAALRAVVRDRSAYGRSPLRARDVRPYADGPSAFGTVVRLSPEQAAAGAGLARDARWAERRITPRVQRVADHLGAERVGAASVLKGPASLNRKLADELAAQGAGARAGQLAATVNDSVRYTFVYRDDQYVARSVRTVQELRAEGFELARAKSFWGGRRYEGVNATFKDPLTGRLFEVQLHTRASWDATVRTHREYELYRDAGVDPALKGRLEREIAAEYATVPRPAGVAVLAAQLRALGTDTAARAGRPLVGTVDGWQVAQHALVGAAAQSPQAAPGDAAPSRPLVPRGAPPAAER